MVLDLCSVLRLCTHSYILCLFRLSDQSEHSAWFTCCRLELSPGVFATEDLLDRLDAKLVENCLSSFCCMCYWNPLVAKKVRQLLLHIIIAPSMDQPVHWLSQEPLVQLKDIAIQIEKCHHVKQGRHLQESDGATCARMQLPESFARRKSKEVQVQEEGQFDDNLSQWQEQVTLSKSIV